MFTEVVVVVVESKNIIHSIETIEIIDGVPWLKYNKLINLINEKIDLMLKILEDNEGLFKKPEQLKELELILNKDNNKEVIKDNKKNYGSHKQKNMHEEEKDALLEKYYKEYEEYKSDIKVTFKKIISKYIKYKECGITKEERKSVVESFVSRIKSTKVIKEDLKEADTKIKNDTQLLLDEVNEKLHKINDLVNTINKNELKKIKTNNKSNCELFKKLIIENKLRPDNEKIEILKLLILIPYMRKKPKCLNP